MKTKISLLLLIALATASDSGTAYKDLAQSYFKLGVSAAQKIIVQDIVDGKPIPKPHELLLQATKMVEESWTNETYLPLQ